MGTCRRVIGLCVLALALPAMALAAAGDLDTSFGDAGIVTTGIGTGNDHGQGVAVQTDGKVVVAGDNGGDFAVVRYNADGSLDGTFGTGGKVTTNLGGSDTAYAVAVQADGKVVAAGASNGGGTFDFAVVRYNPDGTLDAGFGSGGVVITPIGSDADVARAMTLQADGKLVVVGYSYNGNDNDFALVRYNPDGSLDGSFGGGVVVTDFGSAHADYARAVAIQSDGKVVAAGYADNGSNYDFALARYNTDGTLDTGFGLAAGTVATAIGGSDHALALAVQADGKLVAAGYTTAGGNYDFALVRYNANGVPDIGFGTSNSGVVTTPIGLGNDVAQALVVQPDGKLVAAGYSAKSGSYDFALVRYNASGALDTTFGSGGLVDTPIGNGDDYGQGLALADDGRLLVAGYSSNGANYDFAVARYLGDAGCVGLDCSSGCEPTARPDCRTAEKSMLLLKERANRKRNKLIWKWIKGEATDTAEFGLPTGTTQYAVCLYAGTTSALVTNAVVPGSSRWRRIGDKGYKYRDSRGAADGIQRIILKSGVEGKAKVLVKGRGDSLPLAPSLLPFGLNDFPVIVQLVNSETDACWESSFSNFDVRRNEEEQFTAKVP